MIAPSLLLIAVATVLLTGAAVAAAAFLFLRLKQSAEVRLLRLASPLTLVGYMVLVVAAFLASVGL